MSAGNQTPRPQDAHAAVYRMPPLNLCDSAAVADFMTSMGVRFNDFFCLCCGQQRDQRHRNNHVQCTAICWQCGDAGSHIGRVCPLWDNKMTLRQWGRKLHMKLPELEIAQQQGGILENVRILPPQPQPPSQHPQQSVQSMQMQQSQHPQQHPQPYAPQYAPQYQQHTWQQQQLLSSYAIPVILFHNGNMQGGSFMMAAAPTPSAYPQTPGFSSRGSTRGVTRGSTLGRSNYSYPNGTVDWTPSYDPASPAASHLRGMSNRGSNRGVTRGSRGHQNRGQNHSGRTRDHSGRNRGSRIQNRGVTRGGVLQGRIEREPYRGSSQHGNYARGVRDLSTLNAALTASLHDVHPSRRDFFELQANAEGLDGLNHGGR